MPGSGSGLHTFLYAGTGCARARTWIKSGEAYIGALADELAQWLPRVPAQEPIGVCFSGGVDSGSVFLTTYHVMLKLGMNPSRLKAFVLDVGDGPDVGQARSFLDSLGLGLFLRTGCG